MQSLRTRPIQDRNRGPSLICSEAEPIGRWRSGRWLALVVGVVASIACLAVPSQAVGPFSLNPNPYKGTTSGAARKSALACIPLKKLDEEARAKVDLVLSETSVFRRLPIRVVQCDPDMYLFLVRHPDIVVNIWEIMGICQVTVRQVDENKFTVVDKTGTRGTAEFLYSSPTTHIIYVEGVFEGAPLTIPARGRTLLVLKSGYVLEPDGRYYVTSRMDAFVQIEHGGIELLTRTFQPVVGRVVDINFLQTAGFLGSLSRTAEVDMRGMERLADKLTNVQPEVRHKFVQLSTQVARRAAQLPESNGLAGAGPVTLDDLQATADGAHASRRKTSMVSDIVARPEKPGRR